ncbi:HD domain-containing protein [Microbacterium sp. kSW2-24]|uniref:HD domain-containing protein n=1 Tax=Microbacterium galbinum TaxID=2851646 RepID=UPI001FFD6CC8|nr:HD domain-containing protein [Microbacterium galbinum]MCK2024332.1 HD domain-containing protein [Microbacterium galbinum]
MSTPAPVSAVADRLLVPPTAASERALEVARQWCTPAVLNHSLRSWVWAKALADSRGLEIDEELLFVASVLHDVGIVPAFDSHTVAFEDAGAAVAEVFAAGAGWSQHRRERLGQVIQRHMWVSVDVDEDPEGYLLEAATSLDVAHAAADLWDAQLIAEIVRRVPRLTFAEEFSAAIADQAARKPATAAARLNASKRIATGEDAWKVSPDR